MPLIIESHDSLPYIDAPPTPEALSAAQALISAELSGSSSSSSSSSGTPPPPHPSLPAAYAPSFSPAIQAEHERLASGAPKDTTAGGIDLTRYEALDAPAGASPPQDEWRSVLRRAYTSSTYLSSRLTNLHLLERWGKNAWLVGNAALEAELRALEAELAAAKAEIELVEAGRREGQGRVAGELGLLEEAWRTGVGRIVETEVAAEGLRREVLEVRRRGGVGGA